MVIITVANVWFLRQISELFKINYSRTQKSQVITYSHKWEYILSSSRHSVFRNSIFANSLTHWKILITPKSMLLEHFHAYVRACTELWKVWVAWCVILVGVGEISTRNSIAALTQSCPEDGAGCGDGDTVQCMKLQFWVQLHWV